MMMMEVMVMRRIQRQLLATNQGRGGTKEQALATQYFFFFFFFGFWFCFLFYYSLFQTFGFSLRQRIVFKNIFLHLCFDWNLALYLQDM